MFLYLTRKIFAFICSFWVIATLTFFLMKLAPGDPFSEEQTLRRDMHEALQHQHGFHDPLHVQYRNYLVQLMHGNLGNSLKHPDRSVNGIIRDGFPVSARLGLQAFLIALICGVGLGSYAAVRHHRWQENWILLSTTAGIAVPSFVMAALLQYLLAIYFPLFPLARWGSFTQTVLPSFALAAAPMAFITRLTRVGLLEVLQTDYIKLVRTKRLPMISWLWRHALRNAILPVISYIGPLLANVLVGSFVIEKIFSIPGLGQWFVNSVSNRDYPLIMGLTLFYSLILLGSVFLVDLLYGICDPRIRFVLSRK